MVPFQGLFPYPANALNTIPHIHPLTNISLSKLQRGTFTVYEKPANFYNFVYEPPSLDFYTQFSLEIHFFVFWAIVSLQGLTIFIADKIWSDNIDESATMWDRILHAMQKCSFPFPYTNWHEENGNCHDHLRRKKASNQEVLTTILINLFFNMVLLIPLPIFCKVLNQFPLMIKKIRKSIVL